MKYRKTFKFFDTPEKANAFAKSLGRRKHSITPWVSEDGKEHKTVVWYYE